MSEGYNEVMFSATEVWEAPDPASVQDLCGPRRILRLVICETSSSHLDIEKKRNIPAQLSGTFSLMLLPDSKSCSVRKSEVRESALYVVMK